MKHIFTAWLMAMMLASGAIAAEQEKKAPKKQSFTLEKAIGSALENSPRMRGSQSVINAAKGGVTQAGALPNPSLAIEAENFAGSGDYRAADSAEITYGMSQLIEIGGKRAARRDVADSELKIAGSEYLVTGLDLMRDVTLAYNEAVAAQEELELAKEQRSLAGDVLKTITSRVNEAASPLIQKSRAEVEHANAGLELDKAQKRSDAARRLLSSLIGEKSLGRLDVESFYETHEALKPEKPASTPDLAKLDLTIVKTRALAELEEANAVPDPSVNLGVRDMRETDDQAFVLGVSIPIPVFNGNQGNIARARSEVNKAEADKRQAELDYEVKLADAKNERDSSYNSIRILKDEITPSATKAYALAKEGYALGRFSHLEVFDAQKTLFDVKSRYIGALKEYHAANAEIARLTAQHVEKLKIKEGENE